MNICKEIQVFMFDLEILVKTITPITIYKKKGGLGNLEVYNQKINSYGLYYAVWKFSVCRLTLGFLHF